MSHQYRPWIVGLLTALLSLSSMAAENKSRLYYRYVNDQGVKVLDDSIPPEYVQKGYEIVTAAGMVVQVIEPAPTVDEVESARLQREREAELQAWDEELLRRYSSVRDIDATRKRKLDQVQTSIDILQSNIASLTSQIAAHQARAADAERQGVEVPQQLLQTLKNLGEELHLTEERLQQRRQQYREVGDKYDRDKARFETIRPSQP